MPEPIHSGPPSPSPDGHEADESREIPFDHRKLAVEIVRHYNVDSKERPALIGILEKEIKENMTPEERHALLRLSNSIQLDATILTAGENLMAIPNKKILEGRMENLRSAVEKVHMLINDHVMKALAAKKGEDVDTDAFIDLGGRISDKERTANQVAKIEERLFNGKPPKEAELAEWRTTLRQVLMDGIDDAKDADGATRKRVEHLLVAIEPVKSETKERYARQALLRMEGGEALVKNGVFNRDGSLRRAVSRSGEPLRDPVKLGGKLAAITTLTLITSLYGIVVGRKMWNKEELSFTHAFPAATAYALLKIIGFGATPKSESGRVAQAKQRLGFEERVLAPAILATQLEYNRLMQKIYAKMGGRSAVADIAQDMHGILQDHKARTQLKNALSAHAITDAFVKEFAGDGSNLEKAFKRVPLKERVYFLGALQTLEVHREESLEAIKAALLRRMG